MAKKQMAWKTRGMNRDLSVSAFNPEFAFENRNLRLSTNEGNTLLSWVNEKGTKELELFYDEGDTISHLSITGTPIGTATINQYLVIFTVGFDSDRIYRLEYLDTEKTKMIGVLLYQGHLNFQVTHPLETLVSYESNNVQKVYWTDGYNQPRVINICMTPKISDDTYDSIFDFVPELKLQETVNVKKLLGANGAFAPGVIQYAFTYYKKYGQETNIFYTTPLLYISHVDRGASPEDMVDNAFQITISHVDDSFDYLRIYSIQRTSINSTPFVKRVQDLCIKDLNTIPNVGKLAIFTDTGTIGNSVDPTELLYRGGESISALTMEQKDQTLFLGNIDISREQLTKKLGTASPSGSGQPTYYNTTDHRLDSSYASIDDHEHTRRIYPSEVSAKYTYYNQLNAHDEHDYSVPCCGFKKGNTYRCGVQFQYKTGKWSEPFYIVDHSIPNSFTKETNSSTHITHIEIPVIKGVIKASLASYLLSIGYVKARALMAVPTMKDRAVICQGVACPTLWTEDHRTWGSNQGKNDLYAQSSWFFRPRWADPYVDGNTARPVGSGTIAYTSKNIISDAFDGAYNPASIRTVEIEGEYSLENQFHIDHRCVTMHSPDIEFDEQLWTSGLTNCSCNIVGNVQFGTVWSTIDIQTETPPIAENAGGNINTNTVNSNGFSFVAGLFYDDGILEDVNTSPIVVRRLHNEPGTVIEPCTKKWLVYPWQGSGSFNNDTTREVGQGTPTAVLKKKVLSNLRVCTSSWAENASTVTLNGLPQIFHSDEVTITKIGDNNIYQGNIDTILYPDGWDGKYFAFASDNAMNPNIITPVTSTAWWKTFSQNDTQAEEEGLYKWSGSDWDREMDQGKFIGNQILGLVLKRNPVKMKYKSTPHIVFDSSLSISNYEYGQLPILELYHTNITNIYGGESLDALRENTWIPCGEPMSLKNLNNNNVQQNVEFEYSWGDTYYQQWDCLKTYPFNPEDENQVIEIGSFMLETYTNIDGRYDRNRGQLTNVSPRNFNLLNPVYSQMNNFFSYKILPEDAYDSTHYQNQLTWTKTKESGADVDQWTNITLASMLEMDGDKGKVNKLIRFNNYLYAFQDTGISQILYNDNVQISSTDGVPIEIANSGKVQGKDYKSSTIGCSNKWSMVSTPNGIYFMDSNDKSIYLFNGQLTNLSSSLGFNAWAKQNIPSGNVEWTPTFPEVSNQSNFVGYYDKLNQEVLFINSETALAFSEKLNAFTSFYDYGHAPYFCSLEDTGIWLKSSKLWKHQAGKYCRFFDVNKPYWMTLVGNPEPQMDKTFTNLEFRACVTGDGEWDADTGKFTPALPFDSLETWNEYQHGYTQLSIKNGNDGMIHNTEGMDSSLKRKFRVWRCDIPRNNCLLDDDPNRTDALPYDKDEELGVSRHIRKPLDRMRNPWIYLKLKMNEATDVIVDGDTEEHTLPKVEIHDMVMTFFD